MLAIRGQVLRKGGAIEHSSLLIKSEIFLTRLGIASLGYPTERKSHNGPLNGFFHRISYILIDTDF